MDDLESRYAAARDTPSDINEHVPVLADYAARCGGRVLELGVRSCVSSWGLLHGLVRNPRAGAKAMLAVDLDRHEAVNDVRRAAAAAGVEYGFVRGDDLVVDLPPAVDLTFIDTWHVYGHLRRELARVAPITAQHIIMHDTVVDAVHGESVRCGHDVAALAAATGLPEGEITRGVAPAIDEFLAANPRTWRLERALPNNNGLTVLARAGPDAAVDAAA